MKNFIRGFYKITGTFLLLTFVLLPTTASAQAAGAVPTSMPLSQLPSDSRGVAAAPAKAVLGENGYHFTRTLTTGSTGEDVLRLQKWLNANGYVIAQFGPGSPGNETSMFGRGTANALIRFQEANASAILAPAGLSKGTGRFATATRAFLNTLLERAHGGASVLGATDPQSFWTGAAVPQTVFDPDNVAVELGLKFKPTANGTVTGMKFYKGSANTGTHVGTLWTSGGTKLAEGTFSGETSSGWQTLMFSSPVSVTAETTYVVSYNAPVGHYSIDQYYFSSPVTAGDLVAPADAGVYKYGGKSFPDQTWNGSNYWVDVIFTQASTTTTSTTGTLGFNQAGSSLDSNNQNTMNGSRFVTGSSSVGVSSMSVYMKSVKASPNNQYRMAIYSDNGGVPGSLVASTATGTLVANSWNTLSISATLAANTAYWLVYNTNGDNNMSYSTGTSGQSAYVARTFGDWPSTFGNASFQNLKFSIYASSTSAPTTPPPTTSPDTTLPSLSFTAPKSGAIVSGSAVTISANSSDNVGVAGVQFKVGGANIGAEDTSAPYSVVWDSKTVANGTRTLTAVARDAAGNTRTRNRNVNVQNVVVNPSDTTAPSVSFTAPASGATVGGQSVAVSASASDNVGVVGVQFKLGTQFLGAEDTSAPYSVNWDTTPTANGAYTLSATARDAAGNVSTTTRTVTIYNYVAPAPDTTAPSVSFTAPASGATVTGSAVTLSASASDNVGVSGVTFKYGTSATTATNLIGAEDASSPYSVNWNTIGIANGSYVISATARDAAGNASTATRSVTISNIAPDTTAPSVSMTGPTGTVSGTVSVTASASDNIGVAGVQFLLGGVALGTEDTSSPYTISWNTAGVTNGNYALAARARDAAGNTTTSSSVTVSVNNAPATGGDCTSTAPQYSGYTLSYCTGYDTMADLLYEGNGQLGNGTVSTTVYKTGPGSFYSRPLNVSNGTRSEVQYTNALQNPTEGAVEYDVRYEVIVPSNGDSLQWHPETSGSSGSPYLMHDGGKFTWVVWKDGGNTYYPTNITIQKDKWYNFRVEYKFGTPSQGGYLKWYIDGVKVFERLNIQMGDGSGQYLKVGYNGWDTNSGNSRIYYDNLKVYKKTSTTTTPSDTTAPNVSLSNPGATLSGTVTLAATASDNIGVARVEFYRGSTLLGSDTTSPYSYAWSTTGTANGTYLLTAKAFDAAGNSATSSTVTVAVNNTTAPAPDTTAPTVSLSSPIGASILSGTVTVAASASDNVGVSGVTFKYGTSSTAVTTNIGSEDTSSPYSVSWNTSSIANGIYYLSATARDAAGNSKVSSVITVTVNNGTTGGGSTSTCANPPAYAGYNLVYCTDYNQTADLLYGNNGQLGAGSISTTKYVSAPGSFRSYVPRNSGPISSGYRSEVQYGEDFSPTNVPFIIEYDTMFEQIPTDGLSTQWHGNTQGTSGQASLWIGGQEFMVMRSTCGGSGCGNIYQTTTASGGPLMSIQLNKWYHMKWEIKYTSANTGWVRLYIDGTLYYDSGITKTSDGSGQYLKTGQNLFSSPTSDSIIYVDNLRVYKQ